MCRYIALLPSAILLSVTQQFDELLAWEFTVTEQSPGVYRVKATRHGGVTGESTGTDPDEQIEGLRRWAVGVERELAQRTQ
jgi:hypothetical protein